MLSWVGAFYATHAVAGLSGPVVYSTCGLVSKSYISSANLPAYSFA